MDAGHQLLDIASAARWMGITPEAVRKRIARGTLQATKRDGRWYVAASGSSRTDGDGHPGRPVQDVQDNKGIASVARRMGITPGAVRQAIACGTLHVTKRDGKWHAGASSPSRTDGDAHIVQDVQDNMGIAGAASRMGITPEAVRKRIARGTLKATKRNGRWYIPTSDPSMTDGNGHPIQDRQDDKDGFGQVLLAQLIAKDQQISELHRLLAQAATPPARSGRPWWVRLLGRA